MKAPAAICDITVVRDIPSGDRYSNRLETQIDLSAGIQSDKNVETLIYISPGSSWCSRRIDRFEEHKSKDDFRARLNIVVNNCAILLVIVTSSCSINSIFGWQTRSFSSFVF